ncbi:hypothetical protein ASD45_02605 [Pseudolabrys sp. Root1462]|jgi:hypothetical protein|uniref:DUF930 domain-containing protein n=1 Tax=Pseudolabrys sp. Root1462 TaxID=1736466 RepID=UPI000702B7FE|nr:DUF930 domain-containing protein [Pseudolabrys sp. Root1462]KQY99810.1 hypothetical protein ASD45_02605 [Pseudolabrys sp. Root1462]
MRNRELTAVILLSLAVVGTASAETRFERTLKMLMPTDRMAQLCDYTAMTRIRKDERQYRPDRAVANAQVDVKISGNTVEAKGGAFRSRGKWYAMSYTCKTNDDHLSVLSFTYKTGAEIPQEKWAAYGLWQ